jgi:hypothetical protein
MCGSDSARLRDGEISTALITHRGHVDCGGHAEYRPLTPEELAEASRGPATRPVGLARLSRESAEVEAITTLTRAVAASDTLVLDPDHTRALARVVQRRRVPGPPAAPQRLVDRSHSALLGLTEPEMRRLLRRCVAALLDGEEGADRADAQVQSLYGTVDPLTVAAEVQALLRGSV